ncbi:hypothetical protein AKJ16_DCAP16633 [Drosera capensis]
MDDFEKKLKITADTAEGGGVQDLVEEQGGTAHMSMEVCEDDDAAAKSKTLNLLRQFLQVQQRRALAYAKLRSGFAEYMASGAEAAYQHLCNDITTEFCDFSKQARSIVPLMPHFSVAVVYSGTILPVFSVVTPFRWDMSSMQVLELESQFLKPCSFREDLARLLRSVQEQEKQKLQLTATIQVLKKAGRPSERIVTHENCRFEKPMQHECVHLHEITEAAGTEEAEADAEYDNALKEAIKGVQDAVTTINDHIDEVRYEIAALEAE